MELATLAGLSLILGLVLLLPFLSRRVEKELELFFLAMGALSVTVSGLWSGSLVAQALREPLPISTAVLAFGAAFRWGRERIGRWAAALARRLGLPALIFLLVTGLGLLSSVMTAVIAALVLAEGVSKLGLDPRRRVSVAVIACFSIGLGAALTPVGEPLSTVAIAKLAGPPHHADFLFLARLLGRWLAPGIAALGLLAAVRVRGAGAPQGGCDEPEEPWAAIWSRALKVYAFVAALVLLGRGFSPFVERWIVPMPASALYWVNTVSSVLDNATLAAAEVSPSMSADRVTFLLMGILIAGGMLIPGNAPNVLSSKLLGITSREWAGEGVPLGFVLLAAYFAALLLLG